ncbi:STAS domain-containing protein [Streptomyces spiralis]
MCRCPHQREASALFEECRIVRAHGELDRRTVAPLVRAMTEARTARPGRLLLIVDLGQATLTDCSILTPLREAWVDCRIRGGWMRIVYGNPTTDVPQEATERVAASLMCAAGPTSEPGRSAG